MIARQLEALRSGEIDDPEEPDPEQSFRAQWLNQWPRKPTRPPGNTEELLPAGLWSGLAEESPVHFGDEPLFVAVEDDYGLGAAVAAVAVLLTAASRWTGGYATIGIRRSPMCERWGRCGGSVSCRWVRRCWMRVPQDMVAKPAGTAETRPALALFRDLAAGGELVHDVTTGELDQALAQAQVREMPSGLAPGAGGADASGEGGGVGGAGGAPAGPCPGCALTLDWCSGHPRPDVECRSCSGCSPVRSVLRIR